MCFFDKMLPKRDINVAEMKNDKHLFHAEVVA